MRAEIAHVIERFGDAEEEQTLMQVIEAVFLNGERGWAMAYEAQAANMWRPISEGLPEERLNVLIWDGETTNKAYHRDGVFFCGVIHMPPTHWRPLPHLQEGL